LNLIKPFWREEVTDWSNYPMNDVAPDLAGDGYDEVLQRLHTALRPKPYLEIGTQAGRTLAMARCPSIAIDPSFQNSEPELMLAIGNKPSVMLFSITSDEFFAQSNPSMLFGRPIDLAFIDGMHRCEYVLRDFCNIERHCRPNSVVAIHDCLPLDLAMAQRSRGGAAPSTPHREGWWTGDAWR